MVAAVQEEEEVVEMGIERQSMVVLGVVRALRLPVFRYSCRSRLSRLLPEWLAEEVRQCHPHLQHPNHWQVMVVILGRTQLQEPRLLRRDPQHH